MQVYALEIDDFCEEEYSLIGIHSTLEDYRLAYLLNKNLSTRFYKAKEDLEFVREKKKASFSIYNYENKVENNDWFLIENIFKEKPKLEKSQLLLFPEIETHLISEKKKVNYFIKISDEITASLMLTITEKISKIDQVNKVYSIDKNTLKSKDFLIF
jgi:hypothetical protein